MRGIIAALLLALVPVQAFAQFSIGSFGSQSGFSYFKPAAGVSYTGPGDLATFSGWWGLRAYSAAIASAGTQVAVTVEGNGGGANTVTCDITVASNGGLASNVSNCSNGTYTGHAVSTFCGTDATTCGIKTLKDQSGGGHDMVQTTVASQPQFLLNHFNTTLPSIHCVAANIDVLQTVAGPTASQPVSYSIVSQTSSPFTSLEFIVNDNGNGGASVSYSNGSSLITLYNGTNQGTDGLSGTAAHAIQAVFNGASSIVTIDGTQTTGIAGGTQGFDGGTFSICNYNGAGGLDYLNGDVAEVGAVSAALTTTQQNNLHSNQHAYWGTP